MFVKFLPESYATTSIGLCQPHETSPTPVITKRVNATYHLIVIFLHYNGASTHLGLYLGLQAGVNKIPPI